MRRFASAVLAATMAGSAAAAATLTVTTIADSGAGSLRQAILDANANFGDDDIAFSIPGSGVHTIVLGSALPAITHPVTIDGYTQPGSSPNSNPPGQDNNAVLMIEIDGTAAGSSPCFTVKAGNASTLTMVVDGLAINRCPNAAILVGTGGDGALIVGNFIGTDPAGSSRPGPQGVGVAILGAQNVSVRGNLVSGNDAYGISIGTGGDGSAVTGNLIGTNAAGTAPIPGVLVDASGVTVFGSANVTIGGSSVADRNVISGLPGEGITVDGSTVIQANYIQGNYIGTDVTGTQALGNGLGGISASASTLIIKGNVIAAKGGGIVAFGSVLIIQGNFIGTDETATVDFGISDFAVAITIVNTSNCTIGGTAPGEGNVIAHNLFGIVVDDSTGARIRGNRIFDDRFIGIDLGGDGVTQNDAGDADGGANNLQNYPMITSVVPGASTTHIAGFLNGTVSTVFDIDLFSSPACQFRPKSYLEAEAYLGSLQVTTDGSGNAAFEMDVPLVLQAGQPVTATATDPAGNSSEFSQRILLSMNPPSGAPEGGTSSSLTGMLFEPGTTVTVGGVAATNVTFIDPTLIVATMPPRPPGSVNDVTVLVPSGLTGTLRNGWVSDFLDVPDGQQFHEFVVTLVASGISAGVGGGNYGVDNSTLRQQMAVFLLKAKQGGCYAPPPCTGLFPDVPCPSTFADWIEALAAEGITGGCGGGNYCPGNPVRRDQMAVFLLKAKWGSAYVPPPCAGVFPDVPCPSPFADWIEQLAADNITGGCGGGNYCPLSNNTRGQMAVFLGKAFALQILEKALRLP